MASVTSAPTDLPEVPPPYLYVGGDSELDSGMSAWRVLYQRGESALLYSSDLLSTSVTVLYINYAVRPYRMSEIQFENPLGGFVRQSVVLRSLRSALWPEAMKRPIPLMRGFVAGEPDRDEPLTAAEAADEMRRMVPPTQPSNVVNFRMPAKRTNI